MQQFYSQLFNWLDIFLDIRIKIGDDYFTYGGLLKIVLIILCLSPFTILIFDRRE